MGENLSSLFGRGWVWSKKHGRFLLFIEDVDNWLLLVKEPDKLDKEFKIDKEDIDWDVIHRDDLKKFAKCGKLPSILECKNPASGATQTETTDIPPERCIELQEQNPAGCNRCCYITKGLCFQSPKKREKIALQVEKGKRWKKGMPFLERAKKFFNALPGDKSFVVYPMKKIPIDFIGLGTLRPCLIFIHSLKKKRYVKFVKTDKGTNAKWKRDPNTGERIKKLN